MEMDGNISLPFITLLSLPSLTGVDVALLVGTVVVGGSDSIAPSSFAMVSVAFALSSESDILTLQNSQVECATTNE